MKILSEIKSINFLEIGEVYQETLDPYYFANCIDINKIIFNDGYNNFYQTATFEITSKLGRKLCPIIKKFYLTMPLEFGKTFIKCYE